MSAIDLAVLVCGSGSWPERHAGAVCEALSNVMLTSEGANAAEDPVLVHGGCATGVDAIADRWWRSLHDVREPEVYADSGSDRMVERVRELQMAGSLALALCFPWSRSLHTRKVIRAAQAAGVRTIVVEGLDVMGERRPGERGRGYR